VRLAPDHDTDHLQLTVSLHRSPLDARRGIVRLHPNVLRMLGMKPWDPLKLVGRRVTAAMAAQAGTDSEPFTILMDDLTCANAGVGPGERIGIARATATPAASLEISGLSMGAVVDPAAIRFALLGKIFMVGDRISLLPQDFVRPPDQREADSLDRLVRELNGLLGSTWRTEALEVTGAEPSGLLRVTMETFVSYAGGSTTVSGATPVTEGRSPALEDLPGLEEQGKRLRETFDLGFNRRDLLAKLGGTPQMGVLISAPPGSGKSALVEAVAASLQMQLHRVWGPALARMDPTQATAQLNAVFGRARSASPSVVLIEDVDAIVAREEPGPLYSVVLELVRGAMRDGLPAVACTTSHPEATGPELLHAGALGFEIEIPMPDAGARKRILEVRTRSLPLASDVSLDEISMRTPGFVAADLIALCKEASLRAAQRVTGGAETHVHVSAADFADALEVVKPSVLDGAAVHVGDVTLEDVGDMEAVKKQVVETVIWPLRYPDTFERLGVEPARGVLLYGPPGCGKTFLVRAMANEAGANFIAVKGAELLTKWVGESERGVREIFRRARVAAPTLLFFDELDALAPVRGGSTDAGATDRVVAQLLTELDGVEELRNVFVIGATNRPELIDPALLRPGRLEHLVYVPPPDAAGRAAILKTVTRSMPCAPDVDMAGLAASCEGFSAADMEALAREAALTAMRMNMDAPRVAALHFATARERVRPSLDPVQVRSLESFASLRSRA
jgi:transitional endoplasmic reticulum ATPase